MGEAYLDGQKKKAGIKLNDVIEEYRYVAEGQTVKAGDLLVFAGDDVAPAIEPPFNAIALSSGVGGTDTEHNEQVKIARVYKEVITTKTGNIFPTSGWSVVTEPTKYSSNGYTIEASSCQTGYYAYKASDNAPAQPWLSAGNVTSEWIKMTCPKPIKITKMKTYITASGNTSGFAKAVIQGSKDNESWVDLYNLSTYQTEMLTEITLSNTDYYTHYRIVIDIAYLNLNVTAQVGDWETSEYETTEVIQ